MTSGTLHELFEDLYQYSDMYGQEGAHTNTHPPSIPAPSRTPPSSNYRHLQSPSYPAGGGVGQTYGSHQYGTGQSPYTPGGIGAGVTPAPVPPSYTEVQSQREQVAYPYQPSHSTPAYPYQPVSSPASYPSYPYPKSGSSSTSELSDISSGFGTSDGNLTGSSSAIGRSMTSPFTGARPYASGGSSADSSSGLGSYSCETPEQAESAYRSAQLPTTCRQTDSFPAPPPPEASVTDRPNDLRPYAGDPTPYRPDLDSATAPPPAATVAAAAATTATAAAAATTTAAAPPSTPPPPPPPLPPPPPPLPPPKSWKAQQPDDAVQQHQPTRLEQQLSNMSLSSDYGRQNSYPSPVPQSPSHPPGAPAPAPPAPAPYYGAPKTPTSPATPPAPRPQHVVPDAVLNMAARGEPDKKPWTYAPDMESIKEQRDKVRRRAPYGGMPRYQQMLNLPKFDDAPKPRGRTPQTPPTPGQQQTPTSPDYVPGPGEATVAHVQYNSPLYLYSEDNVAEAFSGQTDGVVTGVGGLKKDQGKDITQSPVYRMVHGLDNEKPKQRRIVADEGAPYKPPKTPAEDDELTFSGVIDKSEIPSKSFHKLQNMTAGSEIDTTSIRQNISGEVPDDEIGAYDQASIRYTGRNIPSRSFKMLQSLTGDDSSTDLPVSQPRRQRRHRPEPQPEEPEQNPDDIVDISYVGGNIPSRSFKVLQHAVGEQEMSQPAQRGDDDDDENNDGAAFDEMYYLGGNIPSRSFQLLQSAVGSDPHAIAQERRLRRRNRISSRQNSRTEEEMTSTKSDQPFDEDAYLAGQIPLNVDPVEKPKPKRAERTVSRELAPWEKEDKETKDNTARNQEFDEEAYLSGRIPILGNERKRTPKPLPSELTTSTTEEDDTTVDNQQQQEPFDEEAYLAGRISILGGEPKPKPRTRLDSKGNEVEIPWKKRLEDDKSADASEFDENAYLAKSGVPRALVEQKTEEEPEWLKKRRAKLARKQKSKRNDFDEEKYLGLDKKEPRREDEEEDSNKLKEEDFDEDAYLAGKITILGSDRPVPKREPKPATDARAPWQKDEDVEGSTDEGFDEEAYLQGKVPILRDSVPRELPPREVNKPKKYRERAPWERDDDDDKPVDGDAEFDEEKYLAGRADAYVRNSVDRDLTSPARSDDQFAKIPSRTFHYLRRSMSREGSPSSSISSGRPPSRQSSYDSEEEEPDPNKPYNEMVYVGKKIPSKAFLRLKKSVSRKSKKQSVDPIEHLKERMTDTVDVDSAVENLNIDQHDPDQYLEKLKQTVEAKSNIKIEAVANEVTDF